MNGKTRIIRPGLLTPNSILKSSNKKTFIVRLPCAKHMLGTGNNKIKDTQYLISKDFVTTEKAYGAVNGNQATNT